MKKQCRNPSESEAIFNDIIKKSLGFQPTVVTLPNRKPFSTKKILRDELDIVVTLPNRKPFSTIYIMLSERLNAPVVTLPNRKPFSTAEILKMSISTKNVVTLPNRKPFSTFFFLFRDTGGVSCLS